MNLSKNLTLAEVTKSNTATKYGISNLPTKEHEENLKTIAKEIFQPTREHFGNSIFVSSGYRSKELNNKIKGATSSQHSFGEALDLDGDIYKTPSNYEIFHYIKDNLKFDQLIAEFPVNGKISWVHVSYRKERLRNQILIATISGGKTVYLPYKGNESLVYEQ
tara:strand:+ start:15 stop:503 length:489 start_codon:yes stop_codon:yes gene_type:complete